MENANAVKRSIKSVRKLNLLTFLLRGKTWKIAKQLKEV